jgi:hypothetical protein
MLSSLDTCSVDVVSTPKQQLLKRYKGGDSPPRMQVPFGRCPIPEHEAKADTEGQPFGPLRRCARTEEEEGDDQNQRNTRILQVCNYSMLGYEPREDLRFLSYLLDFTPTVKLEECPSLKDVRPSIVMPGTGGRFGLMRLGMPRLA